MNCEELVEITDEMMRSHDMWTEEILHTRMTRHEHAAQRHARTTGTSTTLLLPVVVGTRGTQRCWYLGTS